MKERLTGRQFRHLPRCASPTVCFRLTRIDALKIKDIGLLIFLAEERFSCPDSPHRRITSVRAWYMSYNVDDFSDRSFGSPCAHTLHNVWLPSSSLSRESATTSASSIRVVPGAMIGGCQENAPFTSDTNVSQLDHLRDILQALPTKGPCISVFDNNFIQTIGASSIVSYHNLGKATGYIRISWWNGCYQLDLTHIKRLPMRRSL